jgi:hypothetical protein
VRDRAGASFPDPDPDPDAGSVTAYEPVGPDLDTIDLRVNRRFMTSLERAAELLAWGDHAVAQANAARRAGMGLGIPVDRPGTEGYRDEGGFPEFVSATA